jgi:CCR4-NOT transcription complex subunit 1
LAVDASIQQIIPPVISRSVTIALITTKELALKDFCLEADEKKVLRGTHLMVQKLSGSLALVTCREPLRQSLNINLRKLLDETNLEEDSKDKIMHIASVDNLDLGCSLIKKAVMEKALEDVN